MDGSVCLQVPFIENHWAFRASLVTQWKESTFQCRRCGFEPWSGRSPGEGNGNPPQYFCLENSMHRGAWQAIVPRVAKSWTQRLNNNNNILGIVLSKWGYRSESCRKFQNGFLLPQPFWIRISEAMTQILIRLLLLSHFSHVWLCATP